MFKKARKFIKKDLQRRYEQLEERFLKFETRLYGRLEERMERLEKQFDELSELIKDSMGGDEDETEVKEENTEAMAAEEQVEASEKEENTEKEVAPKAEKKVKKSPKKTKAKKTSTKKTTEKSTDLKALKGLGPALEKQLKTAGITSLEQLAELTDNDLEALDKQVSGFKQRYERYEWRTQAKELLNKQI